MKEKHLQSPFGINNFDVCLNTACALLLCNKLNADKLPVEEINPERLFRLAALKAAPYENDFEILYSQPATRVVLAGVALLVACIESPEKVKTLSTITAVKNHLDSTLFTRIIFII
jgi:hypothetical protein